MIERASSKLHLSPLDSQIVAHVWRKGRPVAGWELQSNQTDDGYISMSGNRRARDLRKEGVLNVEYIRGENITGLQKTRGVAHYSIGPRYKDVVNKYWEKGE